MSSTIKMRRLDNIVYLLGAGFSAPLNIPVMSNFRAKSKDMLDSEQGEYGHFVKVFQTIDKMHKSKSYYNSDLFNIEEILSILEMREELNINEEERSLFKKYIVDVVQHYTPKLELQSDSNTWLDLFGEDYVHNYYGYFVGSLLNLGVSNNTRGEFFTNTYGEAGRLARYSVITLNYDMVLENCLSHLLEHFHAGSKIGFSHEIESSEEEFLNHTHLAKLHGSVDNPNGIVPPTWNKGLHNEIKPAWKLAYKALSQADQIRIIGYSLPEADAYVKYLLKAAIIDGREPKSIDVLCLDDSKKSVRERFDKLICFPNYRFKDGNVLEYLKSNHDQCVQDSSRDGNFRMNGLEAAHKEYFDR